jgi:hypothetical protein
MSEPILSPQCARCAHYRGPGGKIKRIGDGFAMIAFVTCDAYPRGIPGKICSERHDHRFPFKGDHGIRFEPRPDQEEWRRGQES